MGDQIESFPKLLAMGSPGGEKRKVVPALGKNRAVGGGGQPPRTHSRHALPQVEQRLEPAKRAAHNVHKRLQACLQGQSGADMDKRVKKLPLMALSTTMAESFKELDPDSSMG